MDKIYFVTTNRGKLKTLKEHLKSTLVTVKAVSLDLIEPQSNNSLDIAIYKAKKAFEILNSSVIVEDSSFYIPSLNNFPGPYLKYILESIGISGLLKLMKNSNNRSCYFVSNVVLMVSLGSIIEFVGGKERGYISEKISLSSNNAGWSDISRIFIPKGFNKSISDLDDNDLAKLKKQEFKKSAFSKLAVWLTKNYSKEFNR